MPEIPTDDELATIADPNDRLLHAGARLLADEGFRILANGLSPDLVTRRAGRTRRVFYDRFETKETYLRDLLGRYLDFDLDATLGPEFEQAFRDLFYEAEGDIHEAVGDITAALFPDSAMSTEPLVHAIAWSVAATDPTVRSLLEQYYADVDVMYHGIIEQALASWSQQLRPPWTVETLATTLRCLVDGAYARNVISPGTVGADLFAQQVVALVTPILQADDEAPREFGEELRVASRRNINRWKSLHAVERRANTRGFVLDSVVPALRARETGRLTLAQLAAWADVSEASIRSVFATVDDVIGAAVSESLPPLAREAGFDMQTAAFSPTDMLCRHIIRLGRWTDANVELANGALVMLVQRPVGAVSAPADLVLSEIRQPLVDILLVAVDRGALPDPGPVRMIADMIVHSVLHRSVSVTRSPEELGDLLVGMILQQATAVVEDA